MACTATLSSMDSRQLTPAQAQVLYARLRPSFEYLAQLQRRMEDVGWDRGDRLYLEVVTARHSLQLLAKDVHGLMCGSWMAGRGS